MLRDRRARWLAVLLTALFAACTPQPPADDDDDDPIDAAPPIDTPPPVENCDNLLDDDGDGDADCDDPDCAAEEHCLPEMACNDGDDNDRDGATDCADSDCAASVACSPEGQCTNGADDDLDGDTDCADSDCTLFCLAGCNDGEDLLTIAGPGLPLTVDTTDVVLDLPVVPTGWISGLAVRFTVQHSFPADLDVSLRAPGAGAPTLDLTSDNGGTGQNYVDTYFSDSATTPITSGTPPFTGRFRPEQPFARVIGRPAAGTWQLIFHDDFAGEVGIVQSAEIYACVCDGTAGCEQAVACLDGVDNDGDSLIDCADPADCGTIPQCTLETACADGADNNLDGLVDCEDPDCVGISGCELPETTCTDARDNDADGLVDCADANCTATAHCMAELNCGNGLDDDGDGLTDCLDVGCAGVGICELGTELSCGDGVDNDADLMTDCADSDCAPLFACTACPAGSIRVFRDSTTTPLAIPSNVTVRSTIPLVATGLVLRAAVKVDITHTNDADLDLVLEHPGGTLDLSSDNGGTGDHYTGTVFIDSATNPVTTGVAPFAGLFRPEQPLSLLFGRPVVGNWTLSVTDDNPSATGILHDYQLVVCRCDPATGNCEVGAACRNTVDDDGDGVIDCAEPSCAADPVCVPEANCGDAVDQDLDGLTDCADPDCDMFPGCEPGTEVTCADGFDNDADGEADCADSDCAAAPACQIEIDCDNGLDDDANGFIDCADAACVNNVWCLPEADCIDGTDDDGDGATDCADLGCDGLQGCTRSGERVCGDAIDNDGDAGADCADTECALWCAVAACPAGTQKRHYFATGLPRAIPDNNLVDPATSTITVTDPGLVGLAAVRIDVAHVNDTDLDIFLAAPNGTYELSTDNGSTGDNYVRTIFLDAGPGRIGATGFTTAPFTGSYIPEFPLGGLAGYRAAGDYTLRAADDLTNNVGSLLNYELLLCQCDPASGECEFGVYACRNGVDDDGDGLIDCAEASCAGDRTCMPPPPPASETVCNDGVNEDGDAATDCADSECAWVCANLGSVCTGTRQLLRYGVVDLPQSISSTAFVQINSAFRVTRPGTIFRAALRFNATHTADDDLQLYLSSPAGTILEITSGNGSTGDNYVDTVFVDTAPGTIGTTGFTTAPFTGRYRPEQALSLLGFEEASGLWWAQLRDIGGTADGGIWSELSLGLCVIPPP